MKPTSKLSLPRRRFLHGACGLTLGLPLLEAFQPKLAGAQTPTTPPFLLLVVQANGVVQSGKGIDGSADPERFWPSQAGGLTPASLEADRSSRASGVLAAHAERLTIVRGLSHPFGDMGCMHAAGDAQLLTAAKLSGSGNKTQARGESIDSLIARALNPAGREPLALHAGKYSPGGTGYDIPGYVSYVGEDQPRTYLDAPYRAYQRIVDVVGPGGEIGAPAAPTAAELLAVDRSRSINDLLRGQISELLARPDLSQSDRVRLDQHFSAIRDLELRIGGGSVGVPPISPASLSQMQELDATPYDMARHEELIRLHMQLMVFAIASGYTRVAVLKIGDREDDHQLTIGGNTFVYHTASHRAVVDGASLCSQVDYMHMGYFKELLDQLLAVTTPTGNLLDAGVTVWTNQVANGSHSFNNIPWILAGNAGGFLKTGQFTDAAARNYQTNRMLNTLINASGVRNDDGSLVQNFGDAELTPGLVDEVVSA